MDGVLAPPRIGAIVDYVLSESDALAINSGRTQPGPRNVVREGHVFPAMIVRVWSTTPGGAVQLQVFFDGAGTYWASSRLQGDSPGTWQPAAAAD